MTWPKTTCSTSAGDTLLRSSTDRKTSAPRSQGGTFLRPPPKSPTAVRQAPTTRTSSIRRSEEHTSELQSLMRISYAVFCLKKKKQQTNPKTTQQKKNITNIHNTNN